MRKRLHIFVLVLIASLFLFASQASAEGNAPHAKAIGIGANYRDGGTLLVYGRADDAATSQMLDYLVGNQKNLTNAGTKIVVAMEDVDPNTDAQFLSRAKGRKWDQLTLVKSDGALAQNLGNIGQGGRIAYPSIFAIDATGLIVHHSAGNLSVPQKDNVIRSALAVAKNTSIKMSPLAKKLDKGKTFAFKPKIAPKFSTKYVKYETSDSSIVTVSQSGKVKGVAYGTAIVTADFGGNTDSCVITVTGPLKKIKLNTSSITLNAGEKHDLEITAIEPFNAPVNLAKASWKTANKKIAIVKNGVVTAVSKGTTKITVKLSGKSATCKVQVTAEPSEDGASGDSFTGQVLKLINKERTAKGLAALKNNSQLEAAANVRAKEIVQRFEHIRPDGSSVFTVFPYAASYGGENIASGYDSPEDVVRGWMNSSAHKDNILKSQYRESGIGVYSHNGRNYWVQLFTRKK